MIELEKVLGEINKYYPKNVSFSSNEYQYSKEYLKAKEKRDNAKSHFNMQNHILISIRKIFEKYEVLEWINFEDCNCFEYIILLHKNQPILDDDIELMQALGGTRVDLHLYISLLEKYYYFCIERTHLDFETEDWSFKTISNYPTDIKTEVAELRKFLSYEKYQELSYELINTKVDGIETELKYKGEVTIFDCLFTDL